MRSPASQRFPQYRPSTISTIANKTPVVARQGLPGSQPHRHDRLRDTGSCHRRAEWREPWASCRIGWQGGHGEFPITLDETGSVYNSGGNPSVGQDWSLWLLHRSGCGGSLFNEPFACSCRSVRTFRPVGAPPASSSRSNSSHLPIRPYSLEVRPPGKYFHENPSPGLKYRIDFGRTEPLTLLL